MSQQDSRPALATDWAGIVISELLIGSDADFSMLATADSQVVAVGKAVFRAFKQRKRRIEGL